MNGTCNCGAITVQVSDLDLFKKRNGHICHCINCRKNSGSVWASNLNIEVDKVTITGEEYLTHYLDKTTGSGYKMWRSFCRVCGCPIKSDHEELQKTGKVVIKLGIFDTLPEPEFEVFVSEKVPWSLSAEGTTRYETYVGRGKVE